MTKLSNTFNPDLVEDLNVEAQYQEAIRTLETTHAKLAELPQNPYAPTESLNGMKERMGVEENKNDFSMFLGAGMEVIATDLLSASAGITGMAATALEVGANMAMENANSKSDAKTTFKRAVEADSGNKAAKKSVFAAPKPTYAAKRAPKAVAQTSFMRKAMLNRARKIQFQKFLATKSQRSVYEKTLKDLAPAFREMNALKQKGICSITRTAEGKQINASSNSLNKRFVSQADQRVNDMADKLSAVHGLNHAQVTRALRPQLGMRP